jgi:hypothetical protein
MTTHKLKIQGKARLPGVWRTPAIIFGGLGLAALAAVEYTGPEDWSILGWVCSLALAYAFALLYRGFRDGAVRVLTDPFLILVGAFSLYFLFGTLLLVIGPEDQANYALQWYPTTARDAVRITAMNLIGLATLLLAAGFFPGRRIEKSARPAVAFFNRLPLQKIFWGFLVIGVGAKFYVLSVDFAGTGDVIVHGTIRKVASVTQLAILIGMIYQGRGAIMVHVIATILALFDFAAGLLLFSKLTALMPIVVMFLGLYLRRPSIKIIIVFVVILGTSLLLLARPISDARLMLQDRGDNSISMRLQILKEVFGPNADIRDSGSGPWSRLCYTVTQVGAVDLYENKQGGDDVELLAWVFVPRALVPQKPIITRSGTEFNRKVTGSEHSSTGVGLFISGYYNLGWIGLILASVLAGWIMATFAAISRAVVSSNSMIMLPVGLMGSFMAFRIDGHFVADYLGPFGMIMVPFLALLFILRVGAPVAVAERVR